MKKVVTIWKKEARGHAQSLLAYVMVALTFFLSSIFFNLFLFQSREATLQYVVNVIAFLLLAITPIVTMRTLAEENSRGTLEMLLTSPVREIDIVLGKFLGALSLYVAFFATTITFVIILFAFGSPEKGPLLTQYLGLTLTSAAFISVGLFASSITESQVIAAILGYVLLLTFWLMAIFAPVMPGETGAILSAVSLSHHLDNFGRGVLDAVDIHYYVAFTSVFLFFTWRAIEARRWAA